MEKDTGISLSNKDIQALNDFEGFLSFKPTWAVKKFVNAPHKFVTLFFGNQGGKTGAVAFGYVLKILGRFPIPKKNIVYFECEYRMKAKFSHEEETKEEYLLKHKSLDSATFIFSKIPKDGLCPECGGKIQDEAIKLIYNLKNTHITIRNIPAKVCKKCGNELIDGHTAKDVDLLVNRVTEDLDRFAKSLALSPKRAHNISLAV